MRPAPARRPGARRTAAGALTLLAATNVVANRVAPRSSVPVTLASATALAALARARGHGWSTLGLGRDRLAAGARLGGTAAAGVAFLYTAGALLPATRPLFADRRAAPDLPGLVRQSLLDVPLGTVLPEEIAFRSVLPVLLSDAFGEHAGRVLPVLLFGLWHVLPSADLVAANPALASASAAGTGARRANAALGAVVTTSAGGALFAASRARSGSLLAPALLHTALNSLGYLAAWAVNRARRQ
ncbi:CPBP family intramembrane metalloprotease [Streptomyces durbertensis]|uniref:CPBP family intramembrane metalloprotease n=1 Tax=Streptomyces durbertensis TaxID=2448886 RepID=A0ABR6ELN1_9ACTN|nr:CPBP family glutamic-type intramembrane protease [Streptomyces durbertensis]MBB1246028.1 CPBP family intramembrane metalloprotease [Streptomyces durbertensis]